MAISIDELNRISELQVRASEVFRPNNVTAIGGLIGYVPMLLQEIEQLQALNGTLRTELMALRRVVRGA